MMNTKILIAVCIICMYLAVVPAIAQENDTAVNETDVVITNIEPTEAKFRVAPTVTLRPVNDVINKSQDGLVELYMNNPSVNDVTLNADVQISVPSGIHVYGEGFGYGGAAGTIAGTFELPPGTVRTIHINIKSEKTGAFTMHFTGLYWLGDDKDTFQQISLTHPLTVKEPSPKPMDENPTVGSGMNELPYSYIIIGCLAVIAIAFIAIMVRKPPKT
ncbi:MAG: hypothetical protein ACT6FC_07655, partial [Methanosarcinaceae archaeon]